jgi:teichuronic acid exporter
MRSRGLKQHVVSSLRWIAMAKFGGQVVSWAITIVIIRLLLPADYGLMAMANVAIGFLSMIAEMGFGASLVQSADLDRIRIRQVWGAALLLNAAICVVLAAAAPLIAGFYDEPRLVAVIRIASIQFVINGFGLVPDAIMRRSLEFKRLSIVEIASGLFGSVATLLLAYAGHGVWALVLGGLLATTARSLLLQVAHPVRLWPSFSFVGARRFVSFGASLTLTRLLWYMFSQADILIAGKILGKDTLGLYSVAVHLAAMPMSRVMSVVNDVAFSAFAKIQHDRDAISANVRLAVRLIALLAFPMMWGLATVAPEIVRIAMGPNWLAAILPLQIVALTIPLRIVGTVVSTAIISVGRVDIVMLTTFIGTLLAPPLFFIGARYGIVGLSLAWVVVTPIMVCLNLVRALPTLGTSARTIFAELAPSAFAALLMALGVAAMRLALASVNDSVRLAPLVLTGIALYAGVTALINRKTAFEALQLFFPNRFGGAQ